MISTIVCSRWYENHIRQLFFQIFWAFLSTFKLSISLIIYFNSFFCCLIFSSNWIIFSSFFFSSCLLLSSFLIILLFKYSMTFFCLIIIWSSFLKSNWLFKLLNINKNTMDELYLNSSTLNDNLHLLVILLRNRWSSFHSDSNDLCRCLGNHTFYIFVPFSFKIK